MNFETVNQIKNYVGQLCWVKDYAHGFVPRTIKDFKFLSDTQVEFKLSSKLVMTKDSPFSEYITIKNLNHDNKMFIHDDILTADCYNDEFLFNMDEYGRIFCNGLVELFDIELNLKN